MGDRLERPAEVRRMGKSWPVLANIIISNYCCEAAITYSCGPIHGIYCELYINYLATSDWRVLSCWHTDGFVYDLRYICILGTKNSWLPSSSWWPANWHHSETCSRCFDMVPETTSCLVFNYIKRANQVSLCVFRIICYMSSYNAYSLLISVIG